MSDVTRLLEAAAGGDRKAAADLLPLVYTELRQLAAARLARENPGQTFQPTDLVHEAYLRLVGDQRFDGRGHFFATAAKAMRRILVNHARDRKRLKRGGGRQRVDLDRLTGLAAASCPCEILGKSAASRLVLNGITARAGRGTRTTARCPSGRSGTGPTGPASGWLSA
jgi:RNA polymerase sigma factor (TIGR02999 family)